MSYRGDLEINKIIHLIGAKCAGKTTLLKELGKSPIWDIAEDFYKKYKIINENGTMNWVYLNQHKRKLLPTIHGWLGEQCCEFVYIETSGMNEVINKYFISIDELRGRNFIKTIILQSPTIEELRERCEKIGANFNDILKYNNKWMSKILVLYPQLKVHTYQEAKSNELLWI